MAQARSRSTPRPNLARPSRGSLRYLTPRTGFHRLRFGGHAWALPYNDERMKSGMSRWLDTCKCKQHPGVAASSPLAPDEVGLPFLSRFGSLFRTLIERCEYVSLNVLQNLLSAKLALHVTAVLATSKMNRSPRVYIVLLQNEQI